MKSLDSPFLRLLDLVGTRGRGEVDEGNGFLLGVIMAGNRVRTIQLATVLPPVEHRFLLDTPGSDEEHSRRFTEFDHLRDR